MLDCCGCAVAVAVAVTEGVKNGIDESVLPCGCGKAKTVTAKRSVNTVDVRNDAILEYSLIVSLVLAD